MKTWVAEMWARVAQPGGAAEPALPAGGALDGLQDLGRWDELAATVTQEGQGRVVVAGLPGAGKRLLLNRLRGWDLASLRTAEQFDGVAVESYGSFVLADLSRPPEGRSLGGDELLLWLGDPALVVYVVDAGRGVLAADYRWVALLRAGGRPILVALNNAAAIDDEAAAVAEAARRLGTTVIAIDGASGRNVEEGLLPALLNAVPRLAVPLGREIAAVRKPAARRIIRQAALLAGLLGAQPIPLLELPFQVMLQSGVVMRVGASFGYAPGGGLNREIMATVGGALAGHYLAQTVAKLVPVVGWAVAGVLAALSTLLIGEAAIAYYGAGGSVPLRSWLRRPGRLGAIWRRRKAVGADAPAEEVEHEA
jgi:uncharacterized protein (DUF697 family)